jgi:alkylation response protein AidB-like acyl-CoA dehydrogenase
MVGRALYIESALSDQNDGLMSILKSPMIRMGAFMPQMFRKTDLFRKIAGASFVTWYMNRSLEKIARRRRQRVQAYSSAAKYTCTDLAMENANLALELAGAVGCTDPGIEKTFRDAKLVQIYEGTNQINRLHVWDNLIERNTVC